MRYTLALLLVLFAGNGSVRAQSFEAYIGLGVITDRSDLDRENPTALLGMRAQVTDNIWVEFDHLSAVATGEGDGGGGINWLGVVYVWQDKKNVPLNLERYAGLLPRNE